MVHYRKKVFLGDRVMITKVYCGESAGSKLEPCRGMKGIVINEGTYEPTEGGYLVVVKFDKPVICEIGGMPPRYKQSSCGIVDKELVVLNKRPQAERIATSAGKKQRKLGAASVLGRQSGSQSQLVPGLAPREKKIKARPKFYLYGQEVSKSAFDEAMKTEKMEKSFEELEEESRRQEEEYYRKEEEMTPAQKRSKKASETRRAKYHVLSEAEIEKVMRKRKPFAIIRDLNTSAKITFGRMDPRQYLWALHPGRYDLKGVDTKNSIWWWKHMTAAEKARLPEELRTKFKAIEKQIAMRMATQEREMVKRVGKTLGREPRRGEKVGDEGVPEHATIGQQKYYLRRYLEGRGIEITPEIDDMFDELDSKSSYRENKEDFLAKLGGIKSQYATAMTKLKKSGVRKKKAKATSTKRKGSSEKKHAKRKIRPRSGK